MRKALSALAALPLLCLIAAPLLAQETPPARLVEGELADFGSDNDGDGLFEYLMLAVAVKIDRPDFYSVSGVAYAGDSSEALSRAQQRQYLEAGKQRVLLGYSGGELLSLGREQAVRFWVTLSDTSWTTLGSVLFLTPSRYSGGQFDSPSVQKAPSFTGSVTETAEDLDGNGRYEYLNLSFEMANLTSTKAEVSGSIGGLVMGAGILRPVDPRNGPWNAELRFSGTAILRSDLSGPYLVQVKVVFDGGFELYRRHATRAYNASDFERSPEPLRFLGNGTDRGVDDDQDGKYESLEVLAGVEVSLEGSYFFTASVAFPFERGRPGLLPAPEPRCSASATFSRKGPAEVAFRFKGQAFALGGLDGPYCVTLLAFSEKVLASVKGSYTTGKYSAAQFEMPAPPARFTGNAEDQAPDSDGDGRSDALVVTAGVEVGEAGNYALYAELWAGELPVTRTTSWALLKPGLARLGIKFSGKAISLAGASGPYRAVLHLSLQAGREAGKETTVDLLLPPDKLVHVTKAYRASSFESPREREEPPASEPLVRVGEGWYLSPARPLSVEVNRALPDLYFYYSADNGSSARFRLTFTRLLAFTDADGDGAWDAGEERYQALLSLARWEVGMAEHQVSGQGRTVQYNLSALIDLQPAEPLAGKAPGMHPGWARLTFRLVLSSLDINFTEPSAFVMKGGSEMKLDILLEPLKALPEQISGLALEHFLTDERGRNTFLTHEGGGDRAFRPGADVCGTLFRPSGAIQQRIGLVGSGGREHGYYGWLSKVKVQKSDGGVEWTSVNLTYSTDGTRMALVLNYPYSKDIASLLHDPTVGVNGTNQPSALVPSLEKGQFYPLFYAVAAVVAVAVVVLIRKGQRPD